MAPVAPATRLVMVAAAAGLAAAGVLVRKPEEKNGAEPPTPDPLTRDDLEAELSRLRTELREAQSEVGPSIREEIDQLLQEHTAATAEAVQALNERLAHVGRAVEEAGTDPEPTDPPTGEEIEDEEIDPGTDPEAE